MINQQHSITPPPELVQEWHVEAMKGFRTNGIYEQNIATQAAQWGSDQELEACCEWLRTKSKTALWQTEALRAARRPKPPSLKEQALALLNKAEDPSWDINDFSIVRQALEQLSD
jgi:hypothetical protein